MSTAPVLPLIPDPAGIAAFLSGGVRWRVVPVPLTGDDPMVLPAEVFASNDFAFLTEPISGIDTSSGATILYDSDEILAYFAAAPNADVSVALGDFSVSVTQVGSTGVYIVAFEADNVNDALGTLPDGASIWCIIFASGDFKLSVPCVYRGARLAVAA